MVMAFVFKCTDCSHEFIGEQPTSPDITCPVCGGIQILRHTGTTVPFRESAKCKLCHKGNPELAIQEGDDIFAYHWACLKSGETLPTPAEAAPRRGLIEPIQGYAQLSLLGDVP